MSAKFGYNGVTCLKETDAALLVDIYADEYWIPKSQIDEGRSEVLGKDDFGQLVVTEWIAGVKGLPDPDEEYGD